MLRIVSLRSAVNLTRNSLRTLAAESKPVSDDAQKKSEVEGGMPLYATKASYERTRTDHRFQSVGSDEGARPTRWQRRFLVWTKLYKKESEIPEFIHHGTMNRMHDRMRVVFIIVGVFGFFSIFYVFEAINAARIARDRDAGKVVTKM